MKRGGTILIADDEPHVARVMRFALEKAGYSVTVKPNGAAALEALRESQPDVLITDIEMPRMTGKELCQAVEQEFPDREFIIFILTSRTEIEHREWSRDIRDATFLEKPVSMRRLMGALEDYFRDGTVPEGVSND